MKIKAKDVGRTEKGKGTNPFRLVLPLLATAAFLFGGCATGGKKNIYSTGQSPADSAEFKGGTEYNDRYVKNKTEGKTESKPDTAGVSATPAPFETVVHPKPMLDTLRVDTSKTKLAPGGDFTIIGIEGKTLIVTAPSSRYLMLIFEGLARPPLHNITQIIDRGSSLEIYDEKGLCMRVSGLPGDTVVIEERGISQKVVDGREIYSSTMVPSYKEKGSFCLDTSKSKDLQYKLRVFKSVIKPISEDSSDLIREGVVPPSGALLPYSAFGSPLSVTPTELAGIAILFNIQNPDQWYFNNNSLIKTLRRVNGGSLDLVDLREFFVGPYFNSIRAIRELGYSPNATADLNAAVAFRLGLPWLYGTIGGKGETSVIGTRFVSRGTPYVGLAVQDVWHLGRMAGTHNLGVRFNAYKFEKGYVLDWADTTTLVFENRGWSLDLAYLLSVNNVVGVSLGVNDALYSIYGTKVIYDPSLKEISRESDIYIRLPTTLVTGLGIGGLYSPVVIGIDGRWGIADRAVTFSEIDGAIALAYTLFNVPFVVGVQGGYPVGGEGKWISLFLSAGLGGKITGGGSLGGGVHKAELTDHRYGFGLYGRKGQ